MFIKCPHTDAWLKLVDLSGDSDTDLATLLSESSTLPGRKAAIRSLFERSEASETVRVQILNLTETDDPRIAGYVRDHLALVSRRDPKCAVWISGWLYKTKNHLVKEYITATLSLCAPEYPPECMGIGKQLIKDRYVIMRTLEDLFRKIGKGGLEKIRQFVEAWILEGQTGHLLPYVRFYVYRDKPEDLGTVIEGVSAKDKVRARKICGGLRTLTRNKYLVRDSDQFFKDIEECATKAELQ